jgi:hypothetical protein
MTDQELKDLVASLALDTQALKAQIAASQAEADRRTAQFAAELAEERRKTEEERRKTEIEHRETERVIKELGKQMGGLGNKFGSFTEGLMLPSVSRLLTEKFGTDSFQMRMRRKVGTEWLELDGFGYANGERNIGFVVEVKSHLQEDAIAQVERIMEKFANFYPQYHGMTLYGLIATVDAGTEELRHKVAEAGLYLVSVTDEIAHLETPDDFTPRAVVV